MKNHTRNVTMYCPICGNDLFSNLDSLSDEENFKCSDCGSIFTREQLIEENQENINANIDEIKEEILSDLSKRINKIFK